MPELPEVETIKRELEKAVLGKKISGVIVNNPKVIKEPGKEAFIKGLIHKAIKNIVRKGKLLILELSSGESLTVHLKMTGQLIYPGNTRGSRVSFKFSDGKYLDFCDQRLFGELRLIDDWRKLKFVRELGPESSELNEAEFRKIIGGKKTKIKTLLMDQTVISGIGNLYSAEALFRAGVNPARPACSLTGQEKDLLFKEIKQTLIEAVQYKGSSVDNYVQLSGKTGDYVQFHKVYDRQGKPCLVCKTPIKRIVLVGRGTYFCPQCQK